MAKEKTKKKLLHTTLFDFATEEELYQLQFKRLKKNYTSRKLKILNSAKIIIIRDFKEIPDIKFEETKIPRNIQF